MTTFDGWRVIVRNCVNTIVQIHFVYDEEHLFKVLEKLAEGESKVVVKRGNR